LTLSQVWDYLVKYYNIMSRSNKYDNSGQFTVRFSKSYQMSQVRYDTVVMADYIRDVRV